MKGAMAEKDDHIDQQEKAIVGLEQSLEQKNATIK